MNIPQEIRKEILNILPSEDLPSGEKGLNVNRLDIIDDILSLDPTFSLSGYLRQLKERKVRENTLKKSLAYKIREISSINDDSVYMELCDIRQRGKENDLMNILQDIEYIPSPFLNPDTITLTLKLPNPHQFIKEVREVDQLFPAGSKENIRSYHSINQ